MPAIGRARYGFECPTRCVTARGPSNRSWSSTFPRRTRPCRPPRAACSFRCRSRSTPASRSGRTSRPLTATPTASRTVSSTWARSSRRTRSARTIRRSSARCSSRCRYVTSRYAHSEYQTVLSLRLKAELNRIAPAGTPRHFVVNTGGESGRERDQGRAAQPRDDVAGWRRRLHRVVRRRVSRPHARLRWPSRTGRRRDWASRRSTGRTFRFRPMDGAVAQGNARREDRSLKQLWDLLVSGRLPHAEKSKDTLPARDRRDRRVPRAAWPGRAGVRGGAAREPQRRTCARGRVASPPCSSSRFRARAACGWRARASCASSGS